MPYYLYKIDSQGNLEPQGNLNGYREAREETRRLRKATEDPEIQYRMMFANSETEAETLLTTPREKPVVGDD